MASKESRYTVLLSYSEIPVDDRTDVVTVLALQEEGETANMSRHENTWYDVPDEAKIKRKTIQMRKAVRQTLLKPFRKWIGKDISTFSEESFTGLRYGEAVKLEAAGVRGLAGMVRYGKILNATLPKKKSGRVRKGGRSRK